MPRLENSSGYIHSAFSSIEGEGVHVGSRVIFLRLAGCTVACPYCDTREAWEINPPTWKLMLAQQTREISNPAAAGDVIAYLQQLALPNIRYLSITGGEPLLQFDFTKALAHLAHHKLNLPINLETSGLFPVELEEVLPEFSFISLDVKLPSLMNGTENWGPYYRCIAVAANSMLQVKVIVSQTSTNDEIEQAAMIAAKVEPHIPFILQPVTGNCGYAPPTATQLLAWQELALKSLYEVRIIPQVHKYLEM